MTCHQALETSSRIGFKVVGWPKMSKQETLSHLSIFFDVCDSLISVDRRCFLHVDSATL